MDWTKSVAQSMLVTLIFIRWLRRRLGSTMGSAICDRCDVRSANGILLTTKDEKTAWERKRGRRSGKGFDVRDVQRANART